MCSIDPRRLQHTFSKHAQDFGITGNWNQANAALLEKAIQNHVTGPGVQKIPGTFRGTIAVIHYFDPATDLWVAVDAGGAFVAGWKLTAAQRAHLLSLGNVQ
jgi:hypothetical protein